MMHTVKRKLSQHLPGNSYKSSDPEFNKLRDAFKDVKKNSKELHAVIKGISDGWKELRQCNLKYLTSYENIYSHETGMSKFFKKKGRTKSMVSSNAPKDSEQNESKKSLDNGDKNDQSIILYDSNYIEKNNVEEEFIKVFKPANLIKQWHDEGESYFGKTQKIYQVEMDTKHFLKFLDEVEKHIEKRNNSKKDVDFYRGKVKDLGKSDNAEEKHKTENLEGTLADYEKKHEAHERFCIQNMNKAISLFQQLVVRTNVAFLDTQLRILEQHPFKGLRDSYVEKHSAFDPKKEWENLDFNTEKPN